MDTWITPSNITFGLGIVAILFAVYRYFKEPQVQSEKTEALTTQRMQFMSQESDKRFGLMQQSFQDLLLQSNNHIHTVDVKVESLTKVMIEMGKEVVKLSTIIDERIPKA